MKVWININKNFGFANISIETIENVAPANVVDNAIGKDTYKMISMINTSDYLDDDTRKYMRGCGWQENESYYRQNGDLYSYCFEK
jgi:hypothetical protein